MLACYGAQKPASLSAARYDLWLSKLSKKTASTAPPQISLPPISEAFRVHVKRANLIAAQFLSSDEPHPPKLSPVDHGWIYVELSNCFGPVALPSGVEPAPVEVLQLIRCGCSSDKPCQKQDIAATLHM